jgi:hypothetical protein
MDTLRSAPTRSWRALVRPAFLAWLPVAAAVVVLSGLVYGAVQQSLRSGANDPQLQMAGDLALQLAGGADPGQLVGGGRVDLAQSLAPYVTVFDGSGKVVASTAVLAGRTPVPPAGVLRAARHDRNELTWQPQSGVREAIVVVPFRHGALEGTVLVGRSLTEVERREDFLLWATAAALLAGLGVTAAAALAAAWLGFRFPS